MQNPLVPVAPPPLGPVDSARPGLFGGAAAMLSGAWTIVTTPALWPLALVPAAVGSAIAGGLSVAAWFSVPPLMKAWLGEGGGIMSTFAVIAGVLVAIALAVVVGFALAQPLSGFALEKIVHHVEAGLGLPSWPTTRFLVNLKRSLLSIAVGWLFGLPVLALLFVVNIVVPPATVVTIPLKLVVISLLVAWDLCDYPLSIRGVPIRERIVFMRHNAAAMVGFGLGLALLSLIPFAILFAIPAGVAGATRLVASIERAEGRRLVGKSEEV